MTSVPGNTCSDSLGRNFSFIKLKGKRFRLSDVWKDALHQYMSKTFTQVFISTIVASQGISLTRGGPPLYKP